MERRRTLLRLSVLFNLLFAAAIVHSVIKGDNVLGERLGVQSLFNVADNAPIDGSRISAFTNAEQKPFEPPAAPIAPPPAPARECGICTAGPVGRALCEEWGETAMTRALGHLGTNHRVRRVLSKMRRGEPWTMASLGGSVSTGQGIGGLYSEKNMHRVLFHQLNDLFPQADGVLLDPMAAKDDKKGKKNAFSNGSKAAHGSDYFSYCAQLHVPKDTDLVILEFAINDPTTFPGHMPQFEYLIRSLLEMDSKPAVLVYHTFGLMFESILVGGDLSHGVAQYYDVPTVSSRNALLPIALANKTVLPEFFLSFPGYSLETLKHIDLRHFGPKLHEFSGKVMHAYFETQLCEMEKLESKVSHVDVDELYPVAPLQQLLQQKYTPGIEVPKSQPICLTTDSEKFPLKPKHQNGWRNWAWKQKKYLIADKPGAKLTFDAPVTRGTSIILYFLRSKIFGLGNLKCWVDDDLSTAKVIKGYWDKEINIGQTERWTTTQGHHELHCELLEETADPGGGHEFRLMALMSF